VTSVKRDAPQARPAILKVSWAWLGVLPFFLFALLFLIYPSSTIVLNSFEDSSTHTFTLKNIIDLANPFIINAYWVSIQISVVTALGGGIFGFLLAFSAIRGGLPPFMRSSLMTFSGVASNFAGVPLAFAFIALLSPTGMLIGWLKAIGIDLYANGFMLYRFWGLSLVYMYFQFPLMVLIIAPAIDGLRREWLEASENLGATSFQYWWYVAFPILLPSLLGTMILLFGNAFGAFATAQALTGGAGVNLATIVIGAQLRGDVLNDPGVGYAMALGMVVIMAVVIAGYTFMQRKAERWLR
jgi:putative spermidine/putrescine transport system permease protein